MMIKRIISKIKKIFPSLAMPSTKATPNGSNPAPQNILFIDDYVPHPYLGAGYPRSHKILLCLEKMGHAVTFFPMFYRKESWNDVYQDIPRNIEIMATCSSDQLEYFLKKRSKHYSLIIISRPHNMNVFKSIHSKGVVGKNTRIIYDAEALFTPREVLKHTLLGTPLNEHDISRMTNAELQLTDGCDAVLSVSSIEKQIFVDHGANNTHVLKHALSASPTMNPFAARNNILFVGPLSSNDSPNTDSVKWFLSEILPLIHQKDPTIKFIHAGICDSTIIAPLSTDSTQFLGKVNDLQTVYQSARLFIAPTRFAAGIPLKVLEAAAHGLPIVCTPILATQLGWVDEVDVLTADTPAAFATQCMRLYQDEALWTRIRTNALKRVQEECSSTSFYNTLNHVINDVLSGTPTR